LFIVHPKEVAERGGGVHHSRSGGVHHSRSGDGAICLDVPGWHDSDGEVFDCTYYDDIENACEEHGGEFAYEGLTAIQACCGCGGGAPFSKNEIAERSGGVHHSRAHDGDGSPEAIVDRSAGSGLSSIAHSSGCFDVPAWKNHLTAHKDCAYYADNPCKENEYEGTPLVEFRNEFTGLTRLEACCDCGGGLTYDKLWDIEVWFRTL
jgi:hypothetical protein